MAFSEEYETLKSYILSLDTTNSENVNKNLLEISKLFGSNQPASKYEDLARVGYKYIAMKELTDLIKGKITEIEEPR